MSKEIRKYVFRMKSTSALNERAVLFNPANLAVSTDLERQQEWAQITSVICFFIQFKLCLSMFSTERLRRAVTGLGA